MDISLKYICMYEVMWIDLFHHFFPYQIADFWISKIAKSSNHYFKHEAYDSEHQEDMF